MAGMECFCWLVWLICSLAAVSSWWLLRLLFWGLSFSRRGTKKGPFLMTVLFRIYYCEGCTEDGHRHSLIIIIILDTTNTHWKRCVWAVVLSLSLWVVMVILPTKKTGSFAWHDRDARAMGQSETDRGSSMVAKVLRDSGLGCQPMRDRGDQSAYAEVSVYDCDANCRSFQLFQHARKEQERPS